MREWESLAHLLHLSARFIYTFPELRIHHFDTLFARHRYPILLFE